MDKETKEAFQLVAEMFSEITAIINQDNAQRGRGMQICTLNIRDYNLKLKALLKEK